MAAAAAAGRPVQLLRLGHVDLGLPPPGAVPDVDVETLVAMGVANLEAVYVTVGGNVDDGEPDSQAEVGQPKKKKKKKRAIMFLVKAVIPGCTPSLPTRFPPLGALMDWLSSWGIGAGSRRVEKAKKWINVTGNSARGDRTVDLRVMSPALYR